LKPSNFVLNLTKLISNHRILPRVGLKYQRLFEVGYKHGNSWHVGVGVGVNIGEIRKRWSLCPHDSKKCIWNLKKLKFNFVLLFIECFVASHSFCLHWWVNTVRETVGAYLSEKTGIGKIKLSPPMETECVHK